MVASAARSRSHALCWARKVMTWLSMSMLRMQEWGRTVGTGPELEQPSPSTHTISEIG
jgi:hypothetical protein